MNDFYTYAYLREDGTPYYIGKGKHKSSYISRKYFRAYYGKHFVPIPPKERILILKDDIDENLAFKHEQYMIAVFGRKDLGTGVLRNLTDGGEGFSGFKFSEERKIEISKRMKKWYSLNNVPLRNPSFKNFLLINIDGTEYIVNDGIENFCKNKNIPYEGLTKKMQRRSETPTKCGWYAFDISNKSEKEVEELKNKFILKHKKRFNLDLIDIKISPDIQVGRQSVNLVFNFIKEKIENKYDITYHNNKKYTKITEEEFKKSGVSTKTAYKAVKVLKTNDIIDVEKLNKSNFNQNNYYAICDLKYLEQHKNNVS